MVSLLTCPLLHSFPAEFSNHQSIGDYHDPLTFKVFSNHTPIVAIKSSGNVYAKDSVDRLNVKANFWQDLVSNEPFTREDIITLQDPHNPERRELGRFKHLDADLKPRLDGAFFLSV